MISDLSTCSQIVEARGHEWVLRAQGAFPDRQRPAVKRFGLAVLGSIFEPKSKIVHYPRGFGLQAMVS
jgi:hypothetical protein